MTKLKTLIAIVGATTLGGLAPRGMAEADASQQTSGGIEMWTRGPGAYFDGSSGSKKNIRRLTWKKQTLKTVKKFDLQYGASRLYRGLFLRSILESYPYGEDQTRALLHFAGGVRIPVDLTATGYPQNLNVFIARKTKHPPPDQWSDHFPKATRQHHRYRDPRPIAFSGNKSVVSSLWHQRPPRPSMAYAKAVKPGDGRQDPRPFSPWRFAGSLTGVEFVNGDAYDRQFRPKTNLASHPGYQTFKNRCQYCHSVRGVGADLGWDFLEPIPIYELKKPRHIYQKVQLRYYDAFERGLLMPDQADVTRREIRHLYRWLQELGDTNLKPYRHN